MVMRIITQMMMVFAEVAMARRSKLLWLTSTKPAMARKMHLVITIVIIMVRGTSGVR